MEINRAAAWRTRDEFMSRFGALYEHSPWIAEQVVDAIQNEPQKQRQTLNVLDEHFRSVVLAAGRTRQLALLNAHPELVRAQQQEKLTTDSQSEQSGAGLDRCTREEFEAFAKLNRQYRKRFGFPFIMAVGGYQRQDILQALRDRVSNERGVEFAQAIEQVCRIGRLRLEKIMRDPDE